MTELKFVSLLGFTYWIDWVLLLIKVVYIYVETMGLLQQIMQMVQSLTELGKILLVKEIFSMLTSILRRRNTFFFERLTPHHSTSTPFLTTHIQSSNSYLKWSTSTVTSTVTALFTMELLKGSSEHGKTTIQNLLDTVNAWMWLSY